MHAISNGVGGTLMDGFGTFSHFVGVGGKWCVVFSDDSDVMLPAKPSLVFPEEFAVLRLMLDDDVGAAQLYQQAFDRLEGAGIIRVAPTSGRFLSTKGRQIAESMA